MAVSIDCFMRTADITNVISSDSRTAEFGGNTVQYRRGKLSGVLCDAARLESGDRRIQEYLAIFTLIRTKKGVSKLLRCSGAATASAMFHSRNNGVFYP